SVALNGREISRLGDGSPRRAFALDQLVLLREGQNTVLVTATDADGASHQDVRTVYYDPPLPFAVAVRYPNDQLVAAQPSLVVVATASSSRGITSVAVLLNGTEVRHDSGFPTGRRDIAVAQGQPQRSVTVTVPVTLAEGTNTIVVRAAEPDGVTRQEV